MFEYRKACFQAIEGGKGGGVRSQRNNSLSRCTSITLILAFHASRKALVKILPAFQMGECWTLGRSNLSALKLT